MIPVVIATPETLAMRPPAPRLLEFPLAYGRHEYIRQCSCGYLTEPHETALRAAKADCPRCVGKLAADIRRREYTIRLSEALQVHPR